MKNFLAFLVLLWPCVLLAQSSERVTTSSMKGRIVRTSEIRDLDLTSGSGMLFFTVGKDRFCYSRDKGDVSLSAAEVLAELRRVDKVEVIIDPEPSGGLPRRCFLSFHYRRVRP